MKTLAKNDLDLATLSEISRTRLEHLYTHYLHNIPSLELKKAMEYALFNGGKHLRPLLIYATGCIFGAAFENLDIPASSIELIHTYSLIHDDLPCMDDADLRRGKPSCHKVYGEGMTVLTGDALHTLAMQIIASHPASLEADKRIQMLAVVSKACGPFGMAAGQALDITVMNDETLSTELLENIYRLKTGALFSSCIELGWLASSDEDEVNHQALKQFGDAIGLAFQIQDDILDIESETEILGKTQGKDAINHKITYPKLIGIHQAKEKVEDLYQNALTSIDYLGSSAQLLRELIDHMLHRKK